MLFHAFVYTSGHREPIHVVYSSFHSDNTDTASVRVASDSDFMKLSCLGDSLSAVHYLDTSDNYRDRLGQIHLHTQESIHTLVNHLYARVITEKRECIALVGPRVGGSIALSTLKLLSAFSDNTKYFSSTLVKSEKDAQAIVNAINKGCVVLINPLLKLETHVAVRGPSFFVSAFVIVLLLSHLKLYAHNFDAFQLLGTALLLPAYSVLKRITEMITRFHILPALSNGHYDPRHKDPIEEIEGLSEKITCPIILNVAKENIIIDWKNKWFVRLYKNLVKSKNLHLLITRNSENVDMPITLLQLLEALKSKLQQKGSLHNDDHFYEFKVSQVMFNVYPRVELSYNSFYNCDLSQFESMIYPGGVLSHVWKAWRIPFLLVLSFIVGVLYEKHLNPAAI